MSTPLCRSTFKRPTRSFQSGESPAMLVQKIGPRTFCPGKQGTLEHRSCPIAVSNTVVSSARRAASRHTTGRGDGSERSKVPTPAGHIGVRPKDTSQESMLVRGCCSPGLRQPTTVSRYFRNLARSCAFSHRQPHRLARFMRRPWSYISLHFSSGCGWFTMQIVFLSHLRLQTPCDGYSLWKPSRVSQFYL